MVSSNQIYVYTLVREVIENMICAFRAAHISWWLLLICMLRISCSTTGHWTLTISFHKSTPATTSTENVWQVGIRRVCQLPTYSASLRQLPVRCQCHSWHVRCKMTTKWWRKTENGRLFGRFGCPKEQVWPFKSVFHSMQWQSLLYFTKNLS